MTRRLVLWPALATILLATAPVPALAQSDAVVKVIDKRLKQLESEMRAVQRKVFPGGGSQYFTPEIAGATGSDDEPAAEGTNPLLGLMQRVDGLEQQQRKLTGQIEELQFQLRQQQNDLKRFREDAEFRLDTLEGKSPSSPSSAATKPTDDISADKADSTDTEKPETTPAPPTAEARYDAGRALYREGKYADAAKSLTAFTTDFPKHARTPDAQYWTGRALYADGQNAQAAKAFLKGYQQYPKSAQAPDSLLWLSRSLVRMKVPGEACRVLDELKDSYPSKITGNFEVEVKKTRASAKCSG